MNRIAITADSPSYGIITLGKNGKAVFTDEITVAIPIDGAAMAHKIIDSDCKAQNIGAAVIPVDGVCYVAGPSQDVGIKLIKATAAMLTRPRGFA